VQSVTTKRPYRRKEDRYELPDDDRDDRVIGVLLFVVGLIVLAFVAVVVLAVVEVVAW
jgi:hypothetical protein